MGCYGRRQLQAEPQGPSLEEGHHQDAHWPAALPAGLDLGNVHRWVVLWGQGQAGRAQGHGRAGVADRLGRVPTECALWSKGPRVWSD